jgi:predicted outer membrane repeat protein
MKKSGVPFVFFAFWVFFLVIPVFPQATDRSYYVHAGGDDINNNGMSEGAPFKTLKRAVEVASQGTIKKITVLGTLNESSEGRISNISTSSGADAVFKIKTNSENEVTITGKPNAALQERAILSAADTQKSVVRIVGHSSIRFEHIEISGANTDNAGAGIYVETSSSKLTLGNDAIIRNNISTNTTSGGGGVYMDGGSIIMEEGSEISRNSASRGGGICYGWKGGSVILKGGSIKNNKAESLGGGIYYQNVIFTMQDGEIIDNIAGKDGGGIYGGDPRAFIIQGGMICNNSAKNNGGGIYLDVVSLVDKVLEIHNGEISNNKSEFGAGVYLGNGGKLTLINGKIANNMAEFVGGGVYIAKEGVFSQSSGDVSGNTAGNGEGQDIYRQ